MKKFKNLVIGGIESKVLNLILLGAALRSGALGLEAEDLKDAVRRLIPEKFHELNFRALDYEP